LYFKGKRAISPLIATVLLLAFVVALLTVIIQINPFRKDCSDAKIKITELNGIKMICYNDLGKKITFDIVNFEYPIISIKVSVSGTNKILNIDNLGVNVPRNIIQKISIPYDSKIYGEITSILITPRVNITKIVFECPIKDVITVLPC
jgi:flagellin-like protein